MKRVLILLLASAIFASCRSEEMAIAPTVTKVCEPHGEGGFYLLCEGNMGSNKCSIDRFSYATGEYSRNIYPSRNPSVAMELGDVGNDIALWHERLWVTVNCSNFVEVMDASASHIAQIPIPNCRSLAFDGFWAYVSSYAGPVEMDPNSRRGYVAKIDPRTLLVVDTCTVGYQPEQMCVAAGRLFVANSGGYRYPHYDTTVSIIDLATFSLESAIEVAPNLKCARTDARGMVWVGSLGNYSSKGPSLHQIDPRSLSLVRSLEVPCQEMTFCGDSLICFGAELNGQYRFSCVDVVDGTVASFELPVKLRTPYGIHANETASELFVADAVDYVTPGKLYCFSLPSLELLWSVTTGDIPAHFAAF